MASEGPERASQAPSLTSLPRVEDLPSAADGFDREKVREAFEAYRRHTTQLQVQLRVLQAAFVTAFSTRFTIELKGTYFVTQR